MINYRQSFPSQDPDENVYIFLRRSLLNFLPTALLAVVLFGFGLVMGILFTLPGLSLLTGFSRQVAVVFVGVYMLFAGLFFAVAWLDFYFDVSVLTNKRLVDINQNRLFSRTVSELQLEDIEDVTALQTGILETLADFGDVEAQTAGATDRFLINKVPFPREVANLINELSSQAKEGVPDADRHPVGAVRGILEGRQIDSDDEMRALGAVVN